jgi:hypothetical protein
MRSAVREWRGDLAMAWRAFWISRLLVWVTGLGAIAIWGVERIHRAVFDPHHLTRPFGSLGDALVAPAARWDAVWFLEIARSGYSEQNPNRAAFFPLYPLLVHVGGWLGSPLIAGMVISMACFVVALAALHRLTVIEIGPEAARWTVIALALFPGSLWFSAVYSESLFLMVSVGAVLCARQERWWAASALAGLGAATRSAGILLLVPLGLLWWEARRAGRVKSGDVGAFVLVPLGLGAFCVTLAAVGMSASAPFSAQNTWARSFQGPWAGVWDGATAAWDGVRQLIHGPPPPLYFDHAVGDAMAIGRHNIALFLCLLIAIPMLVGAFRRLPLAHAAYALVALMLPLSYPVSAQPLMSIVRFESVLYPLFMWLGWWLARRGTVARAIVLGVFSLGLAACSALFATWHWVA